MSVLNPNDWVGGDTPSLHVLLELLPTLVNEDPLVVATKLRSEYGRVVRVPPLHPALDTDVFLVSDPDAIRFVLQSDPSKFRALDVPGSRDFGRIVRNSIVSLNEEDEWTERLRLVAPEFSEATVESHVPHLANTTLATLAELTEGPGQITSGDPAGVPEAARVWTPELDGVLLLPAMRRLTLRLLGDSLFGPDMRAHEVEVIDAVDVLRRQFKRRQLHLISSYLTRHLPETLQLPRWLSGPLGTAPEIELTGRHERRTLEAVETLQSAADAIVARRERTPLVFDDALGEWLRRPDPVTGDRIPPEALRQEVLGLLIAGHATMSAGLTWAFYLLASRPAVQERLHAEARDTDLFAGPGALDDDPPDGPEDACHPVDGPNVLEALQYTGHVWMETLRLYPPLPFFGRTTRESVTIGDASIESGGHVLFSPYVTHRDPELWDDPEVFDPSRFDAERRDERHEFAYYPFSGGRHACLGEAIATTEATIVLAATLATHRVEFVGTDGPHTAPDVGVDSAINLQPDREIPVRFVPRA